MTYAVSEANAAERSAASTQLFLLDGERRLLPADVQRVATPLYAALAPTVRDRVERGARFVQAKLESGARIHGLNAGIEPLAEFDALPDQAEQGINLVHAFRAGQGAFLPAEISRAMLLTRLWTLARGQSGVGAHVVDHLCAVLSTSFAPAVPEWGADGVNGEMVPMAHLVAALRGEGEAFLAEERLPAARALIASGLRPMELRGRDAAGLLNGTSASTAAAAIAVVRARSALAASISLTALLAETLGAAPDFADPDLLAASGHAAASSVAAEFALRLAGNTPSPRRSAQESYTLRAAPQLLGAVASTIDHAEQVIGEALNGIADNPIFFPEQDKIVHGANGFGQQVAFVSDALNLALVQMANLAERQLELLLDPNRSNGLAPMLSPAAGAHSGLLGVSATATSIVMTMRRHANPASIQSLPTGLLVTDLLPCATQAALEAYKQAQQLDVVQGSVALALRQARYLGARRPSSAWGRYLLDALCDAVPPIDRDRPLSEDVLVAVRTLHTAGDSPTFSPDS